MFDLSINTFIVTFNVPGDFSYKNSLTLWDYNTKNSRDVQCKIDVIHQTGAVHSPDRMSACESKSRL